MPGAADVASTSEAGPWGWIKPEHVALHEAIRALPDRQREVTVLRFLVGLSTREVAQTLGCPAGTVKSNLYKAVANLHAKLRSKESVDEV